MILLQIMVSGPGMTWDDIVADHGQWAGYDLGRYRRPGVCQENNQGDCCVAHAASVCIHQTVYSKF